MQHKEIQFIVIGIVGSPNAMRYKKGQYFSYQTKEGGKEKVVVSRIIRNENDFDNTGEVRYEVYAENSQGNEYLIQYCNQYQPVHVACVN